MTNEAWRAKPRHAREFADYEARGLDAFRLFAEIATGKRPLSDYA